MLVGEVLSESKLKARMSQISIYVFVVVPATFVGARVCIVLTANLNTAVLIDSIPSTVCIRMIHRYLGHHGGVREYERRRRRFGWQS